MACFDATFLVDFVRGSERAKKKYEELRNDALLTEDKKLSTSIISVYELEKGAKISDNPAKDLQLVHNLLSELTILEFDLSAVNVSSDLYSELSKKGKLIGEFDILIAATCLAAGQTLVTNDADFDTITRLKKLHY
jgi:tRNA(fMet)-specific endonuclease VapC